MPTSVASCKWEIAHGVCFLPPAGQITLLHLPHAFSCNTTQVWIWVVDTDPKSVQQHICFARLLPNLPNKHHLMRNTWHAKTMCSQCGEAATKPNPIWSTSIEWDVVKDWHCSLLTWPDGGLVPTPVFWPQHADSTPPAVLWPNRSGSLLVVVTQTHMQISISLLLQHGGDQLAGNEAEKYWCMRRCPLKTHCKVKLMHTCAPQLMNHCVIFAAILPLKENTDISFS